MSHFDLVKPSDTLYLTVMSYAVLIEQQFGELLYPPPPGIYKLGETEPCIISTKRYYSEKVLPNKSRVTQPITDFDAITDHVVNENGQLVIPAYMMKDKPRYLSTVPTVPLRGLILVELFIKNYLDSICPYRKYNNFADKINNHILPGNEYLFDDGHLETTCQSLFRQIDSFIGKDDWHIYFVKRLHTDIIVEKTIDYRVHCWNEQNEQAQS